MDYEKRLNERLKALTAESDKIIKGIKYNNWTWAYAISEAKKLEEYHIRISELKWVLALV